jgi:hypothetical protein
MPFQEKSAWSTLLIAVAVIVAYPLALSSRTPDPALISEVNYVWPMLSAALGWIVASIVLHIAIAAVSPAEANIQDERDREVARFADNIGFYLLSLAAVGGIALAMLEFPHFWIANGLFGALALSALLSSVARIVAYRRGLPLW